MPKRTAQRYRLEPKPAKGSKWVRLGRDHYAQGIIEATFTPLAADGTPDTERPRVWMLVGLDAMNTPQVYELRLTGDAPLTSTSIRLPLQAMTRAALACLSFRLEKGTAHAIALPGDTFEFDGDRLTVAHLEPDRLAELERDAPMRPRANRVDLDRVAAIVLAAPYRDRRRRIREAFGVSEPTAKALIAKARRSGLLG